MKVDQKKFNKAYKNAVLRRERILFLHNKKHKTYEEIAKLFKLSRTMVGLIARNQPKLRKKSLLSTYLESIGCLAGRDRQRELVRMKFNHICQDCKKQIFTKDIREYNKKYKGLKGRKKSLDIHHTHGMCGKLSTAYDKMENLYRMIPLCHRCHYNRPEHKVQSKKFKEYLSERMIGNKYAVRYKHN